MKNIVYMQGAHWYEAKVCELKGSESLSYYDMTKEIKIGKKLFWKTLLFKFKQFCLYYKPLFSKSNEYIIQAPHTSKPDKIPSESVAGRTQDKVCHQNN